MGTRAIFFFFFTILGGAAVAQAPQYDEAKVPSYELPDAFTLASGKPVPDGKTWKKKRRPEILHIFRTQVYGRVPGKLKSQRFELRSADTTALHGKATRKEVRVWFTGANGATAHMDMLLYLPRAGGKPVPLFLGLNYFGNQSIHKDPGITLSTAWMRQQPGMGIENNLATDASRGVRANRWPVEEILAHGFGLATVYYGDIDPDYDDGFRNGIHPLFYEPGRQAPAPDEWGSIAAWAWGLQRAMDYLETDRDVDRRRVAVMGHSRLGKAALWAGAQDERFALVISNDSGCGGAALSRRRFGETILAINENFPHWFCANFRNYNGREDALPVDQHLLLAAVAPRPLYVASASEDLWADPRGEFLAAKHAGRVYEFLGVPGLPVETMPSPDAPVMGGVGYHIRTGRHDVTAYDWEQFIKFAERHFRMR